MSEDNDLPEAARGFFLQLQEAPDGSVYRGRLQLHDIQWATNLETIMARTTVTARMIVDASASRLIWTDQINQRGIRPEAPSTTARELALAAGYPDKRLYIFKPEEARARIESAPSGYQVDRSRS